MGPLSTESKQTSSVMESEHGSTPTGCLRIHPDSSTNGVDLSTSGRKLRSSSSNSSSSSPDSPFNNPFEEGEYETKKSSTGTTPAKLHEDAQLPSTYGENNVSGSSILKDQQSNHELPVSTLPPAVAGDTPQLSLHNTSTTESPPIQAMERSGDSSYRIPSRVFARTPSTTPVEWSAASNESLFSIHMGNMSFIKDPMFWRSGELGLPGEPTTSPQMFNFSPNQPPVNITTDASKSSEGNVAEAAVETMKEVIRESAEDKSNEKSYLAASVSSRSDASVRRESAEDKSNEKSYLAASISSRSDASGASVKSFAFPILTGDIGKGSSVKRSSSPRVGPEHLQPQTQTQPQPQKQPQMQTQPQKQPQTEPQPQSKPMTPTKPPIARTRWLDYFTCCSFCY